ncbi:pyruvate dehydrogenase complex transcriptional repressor PdhR [Alginatibacterium sediminis]|uniref:Pyruvate dehydrogenase complex repressor n=1 Tax=Alginatibacterium sediminis TaxID=2164068 RepID=A0A420EJM8_9ALTE|nr:pyruvate dehydrogenase complex transcriptional repressor PdhR [Alginatibacterium sediminis]RKF20868.1 pyruvate dehydrogenase complex transcriptional repressor PdhR [Alginatibacterium sediminis]
MSYQPVRQAKLADVIMVELERMILEGSLGPGERLPAERELAKQFDVSRPSLREAIQKLEAKGLVSRRQGGGTFVEAGLRAGLTDPLFNLLANHDEAQLDLLEFRFAVEGISAYYAAIRGTDADIEKVQSCYQEIELAQTDANTEAEAQAVLKFYEAITEASHNLILLHLVRGLSALLKLNIQSNLELLYRRSGMAEELASHRQAVLQAIIDGKADDARQSSQQHLAYIEATLLEIDREESRIERSHRRLNQLRN